MESIVLQYIIMVVLQYIDGEYCITIYNYGGMQIHNKCIIHH